MENEHQFLQDWFSQVYGEIRMLAHARLKGESPDHTFDTTDLVHEAYLRLEKSLGLQSFPRAVFFSLATQAMRRILIDHAREQKRKKRGAGQIFITHHEDNKAVQYSPDEILAVNDVMEQFKKISERQHQVVEYWFFGGFKHEEIAEILDVSLASVRRDWRLARAWLSRAMKKELQWTN